MEEKNHKWYIIQTQHSYENKVRERLEKRIKENGMSDLIVDIYIPSETVSVNKNGKRVTKEEGKIVPSPLSDADVARIFEDREAKAQSGINELIGMEFDIGEKVQVIDGPFNGLNGIIENINLDKGRVTVKIEIFGRSTPTELEFSKVKKL